MESFAFIRFVQLNAVLFLLLKLFKILCEKGITAMRKVVSIVLHNRVQHCELFLLVVSVSLVVTPMLDFFFFKWLRGLVLATLVHKLLRVLLRLIMTDVERFSFG